MPVTCVVIQGVAGDPWDAPDAIAYLPSSPSLISLPQHGRRAPPRLRRDSLRVLRASTVCLARNDSGRPAFSIPSAEPPLTTQHTSTAPVNPKGANLDEHGKLQSSVPISTSAKSLIAKPFSLLVPTPRIPDPVFPSSHFFMLSTITAIVITHSLASLAPPQTLAHSKLRYKPHQFSAPQSGAGGSRILPGVW